MMGAMQNRSWVTVTGRALAGVVAVAASGLWVFCVLVVLRSLLSNDPAEDPLDWPLGIE